MAMFDEMVMVTSVVGRRDRWSEVLHFTIGACTTCLSPVLYSIVDTVDGTVLVVAMLRFHECLHKSNALK